MCDPVLLGDNGNGDRLCEFYDDEAQAGDQYHYGGEYRNKHYRMDFVSVVHRGIRRFGNDSVHCHYYGTGCSDRHHSQDVLQTISL